MFRKDWQQPDLHKPGDRVAFPVCLSLCVCTFLVVTTTRGLGDHFSLRSIIVLLVAVYIVVSASEGAVHMVAGVLWRFDIEPPPKKKRLMGDLGIRFQYDNPMLGEVQAIAI